MSKPPVIWCVGGSDSSAHAGLQADLRTGQDLGCHVQSIVTCVTAQNSKIVDSVEPVSVAMFDAQWHTLLDDVWPQAIKVSLLPNYELVVACSKWLANIKQQRPEISIVFDPVMAASSEAGNRLQQSEAATELLTLMLPYVDYLTPNLLEFEALTQISAHQPVNQIAFQITEKYGVNQVSWLLKGGHHEAATATDWWFKGESVCGFSTDKLSVHNTRGTGCTLSTALACFLGYDYFADDAITMAKAYITGALKTGVQIGQGAGPLGRPGWPEKIENLPNIVTAESNLGQSLAFAEMNVDSMGLYPVVDSIYWLERVLKQGVRIAQLRIKDADSAQLDEQIQQAILLGKTYQAQVFINDYWEKAIEYGAYGVHLGQEDLLVADLARIQQAGLRLGVSTHGYFEIARALAFKPSYIALGHIYPTQTKQMPSQPQGLKRLQHYVNLLKGHYPTVAIGGINCERFAAVTATGVNSVAMVTAITLAESPEQVTRFLIEQFAQSKEVENANIS
ncbi:thiamine phosphate synthase [Marinomonas aquiplantarum]|uniref:Thiamine-phosphate synthase n=1 Tax=Marinomonas aquiplantarum TaxID=491951 RepID=A0A366CYI7_9GAMM|nr:thiamine phosphate synthase [Marinomonas aquiplantarum]RBO82695.1 thiamine-phosphate diphosphorylase [Marinomonas aquiplantarum]